jgi:hypothetical protein
MLPLLFLTCVPVVILSLLRVSSTRTRLAVCTERDIVAAICMTPSVKGREFTEICIHYYYNYIIKRQQHDEAAFDPPDSTTTMFEYVK